MDTVRITELSDGWAVDLPDGSNILCTTGVDALNMARQWATGHLTEHGLPFHVMTVEWSFTTKIGRAVARTLVVNP